MDKKYFEQAAMEVAAGRLDQALMIKAIALAAGDDSGAKALYLALRAEEIQREARRLVVNHAKARAIGVAESAGSAARKILALGVILIVSVGGLALVGGFIAYLINSGEPAASVRQQTRAGSVEAAPSPVVDAPSFAAAPHLTADAPVSADASEQVAQFNMMLDVLIRRDIRLDEQSSAFDEKLVAALDESVRSYERRGASPPRALQAAASDVLRIELAIPPVPSRSE